MPSETVAPIIYTAIAIIITLGICIGVLMSISGVIRILALRTTTVCRKGQKLKLINQTGKGNTSPFCFCGSIYISEADFNKMPEMILTHENSHIRHLHFIDLFIGQLVRILQWWNPLAWMMVREMQMVHEYQADSDVLEAGYDSKEYQYLLLDRATGDTKYTLTNGFRHRELKRRLRMINREKPRRSVAAVLFLLIPASFITFALPTTPIVSHISASLMPIGLSSLRNESQNDSTKTLDGPPLIILNGSPIPNEELTSVNPEAIESISVWKDQPEYPNGVIEIKTKPGMDIFQTSDKPKPKETKELRILGYGTERKPNP